MAQYSPLHNETIFDIAVKLYADFQSGISDLLNLNGSIDLNLDDYFGTPINYTIGFKIPKPVIISPPKPSIQQIYLTRDLQSIYDLTIQLYGNLSSIGKLLEFFPNLNSEIQFNSQLNLVGSVDPIVNRFRDNNTIISTDIVFENFELREDGTFELREDGSFELRE